MARNSAYRRGLGERFGRLPRALWRSEPGAVWLHAVSVGEAIAAVPLVKRIRAEMPEAPVYVSVTTLAGRALAEEKLRDLAAGVFYAPLDYRFAVRRVLRRLKPSVVAVMETEIWPNLWRDARLSGAGLIVLNGRISVRALPRYRRLRWFFRQMLPLAGEILAQDETAAGRFRELGARAVTVAGNLKYDFDPSSASPPAEVERFIARLAPDEIWIAASTMPPAGEDDPDEDGLVIEVFRRLAGERPRMLAILVPRRPERFGAAAEKLAAAGVPFVRRSALGDGPAPPLPGVLLLDSIGELSSLFPLAGVVFVGGSLARRGGHNILEPAFCGVPVVTGPHMENFAEIAEAFRAAGAVVTVRDAEELTAAVSRLLDDPAARAELGRRGREAAAAQRGASARAVEGLRRAYDHALVRPWPHPVRRALLGPAAALWRLGVRLDRAARSRSSVRLEAPVVSVGNLAMGGTGKTPFAIWLSGRLKAGGRRPAVLLRGYRRGGGRAVEAFPPGARPPAWAVGEEALLHLLAGHAAVGVGADRLAAWRLLRKAGPPDAVVLDDGFQHWPVRRDADIVLIDAVDPYRGGVFPLGRLREPFAALGRATAVVLMRSEAGRAYPALEALIRRFNRQAPIFHARYKPRLEPLPAGCSVGAFCGLGHPASFAATLRQAGVAAAFLERFPDHHHYTAADLEPLAARADVLVTTAKDRVNIAGGLAARLNPRVLEIEVEVDEEAALLDLIERRLRARAVSA
jgi:tetraacyldisaccharide 4'-kinase